MSDNHGNTPAAWTAVVVALVGFVVGGIGLMLQPVSMADLLRRRRDRRRLRSALRRDGEAGSARVLTTMTEPATLASGRWERMLAPTALVGGLGLATLALHLRDPHDSYSWGSARAPRSACRARAAAGCARSTT